MTTFLTLHIRQYENIEAIINILLDIMTHKKEYFIYLFLHLNKSKSNIFPYRYILQKVFCIGMSKGKRDSAKAENHLIVVLRTTKVFFYKNLLSMLVLG